MATLKNYPDKIRIWDVDAIKPYDRNPRKHSDSQVEQICASIQEFGFTNPLLIDTEKGILAGHGRYMAAKRLGLNEIPVIVLDGFTERQKQAYIIADNKIALEATWDEDLLAREMQALQANDFDLSLTGFSDAEINSLLEACIEEIELQDTPPEEGKKIKRLCCPKCGFEWEK